MVPRSLTTVAALVSLALLTACGGGSTPSVPETARNDAFTADAARTVTAARSAARSRPMFGSVHQTARAGSLAAVIAVDATRRSDGTLDFVVQRRDGSRTALNSGRHGVTTDDERSPTGRTAESGTLLDFDSTHITAATGLIDYDPTDLGDWVVGGYWLHIAGNWANGTVSGVEVGAFVDGPELDNDPVPTSGTATYRGLAGGLFAARFGTDDPNVPAGTHEIGEYDGEFMATADFGAGTVSGSIAVTRVVGIGETPAGQTYDFDNAYEARLILDPASIDAATGTLEGRVRLVVPGVTVTSQDGSWGSRLSNRNDGNGHPRALAGTHAGAATTTGGSEVAYIGAHFGTTGNF